MLLFLLEYLNTQVQLSEYLSTLNITMPSIKNIFGASLIMSMALFPYIFLITKAQLSSVGVGIFKAAKSLGNSNLTAIKKLLSHH